MPALYQFLSLCGFERLVIRYHKKETATAVLGTAEMQNAGLSCLTIEKCCYKLWEEYNLDTI